MPSACTEFQFSKMPLKISLKRKGDKEEGDREKEEENHKGSIMVLKNRRYLINVA